jgi:DNA-binding NtrC family response regulator
VPSLRERRGDIVELAHYFLERHRATRRLILSDAAADALAVYTWPGNVRELERLMERAVALADTSVIELEDLPPIVRGDFAAVLMPSLRQSETMRTWGSRYARLVLNRCGGNKREASRILGISYHTLIAYLRYTGRSSETRSEAPSTAESSAFEGGQSATAEPVGLEVTVGRQEDDAGLV